MVSFIFRFEITLQFDVFENSVWLRVFGFIARLNNGFSSWLKFLHKIQIIISIVYEYDVYTYIKLKNCSYWFTESRLNYRENQLHGSLVKRCIQNIFE